MNDLSQHPLQALRTPADSEGAAALRKEEHVGSVIDALGRQKQTLSTRRNLLGSALRLTRGMSPKLIAMVDECRETLGIEIPTELYVFSNPQFNAFCIKPEDGRLFLGFTSAIIEKFSLDELKFVLGHEFGHYLFEHHDIPIGVIMKSQPRPSPQLALKLFAWSRAAEISADRAGALCSKNLDAVASSMFKLASGVTSDLIQIEIDDFVEQLEAMQKEGENSKGETRADWFSTHPFSPLRLRALQLTFESEVLGASSLKRDVLESEIANLLGLMSQNYLQEKSTSAEALRRFLFAASISVGQASGTFSAKEQKAFEDFFGEGSYQESIDEDRLLQDLERRAKEVLEHAKKSRIEEMFRDLTIIARADSKLQTKERLELQRCADLLGLGADLAERLIQSTAALD